MNKTQITIQIAYEDDAGLTLFCDEKHVDNLRIVMEKFGIGFSSEVKIYYLVNYDRFSANKRIPIEAVYSALSNHSNGYKPDWDSLQDSDVVEAALAVRKLLTERNV